MTTVARERKRVAGILLAAGQSSRFSSATPKQLLRFTGEPLVRRAAQTLLASRLDDVLVVLGHEADAVWHAIEDLPLHRVLNRDYVAGQSTSVRAGLAALKNEFETAFDGALFAPCDQPLLTSQLVDRLLTTFAQTDAGIVRPVHRNRPSAPVLWARRHFPALEHLQGDTGGRALLRHLQQEIATVDTEDPAPLLDIDTLEDWQRIKGAG